MPQMSCLSHSWRDCATDELSVPQLEGLCATDELPFPKLKGLCATDGLHAPKLEGLCATDELPATKLGGLRATVLSKLALSTKTNEFPLPS